MKILLELKDVIDNKKPCTSCVFETYTKQNSFGCICLNGHCKGKIYVVKNILYTEEVIVDSNSSL